MKIRGQEIKGPNRVTLVLPRGEGDDIAIIASAIMNMDELDEFLVLPKAPARIVAGGTEYDHTDKGYVAQMIAYNVKRMAWIVIKSLEPTEIEWSTVKMEKPSTWINYESELREAGFSVIEVNRITNAALQANALDEEKIEAARQVFLRGQAEVKSTNGPSTQQPNSSSGSPAQD